MIVQAPDGKTIDFGDMAPEQITGAMQKMYAPQAPQQPSDPFVGTSGPRLQQIAKGATFGLSDEIGAGLGAARMAMDRGSLNNLGEDYNVGLQGVRQEQAQYEQQNPVSSFALQALGGLPVSFGAGSAISTGLRGSNLATRMAASGAAGAASGATYGFGTGEGQDNRLESAGQGAMVGGALGTALPFAPAAASTAVTNTGAALKTGARGLTARSPEALQETANTMKSASGNLYNQMRKEGAVFNQQKTGSIVSNIDKAITSQQFIPQLNPKTLAIVDHLKEASATGTLGLNELDQYRRLLTRVGSSEDGVSAGAARRAIDDAVNSAAPADLVNGDTKAIQLLNKGRADYARSSRFEDVSDILVKANGDANKIKSGLTRFVSNDDNLRGFSMAEKAALKKAANTGIGENILKAFGKFGFDFSKSGTGNTVLPALLAGGGMAGVPGGVPLAVGGTIARQAQKYIARGKAENALRAIENSGFTPYADIINNIVPFKRPPQ